MSKKIGRPTSNPRPHKISIRINDHSKRILDGYREQNAVSTTEAVERGIAKLEGELKEKENP